MILYFSGRCCGEYDIPSRPETVLERESNIMMSYRYAKHEDKKRFKRIYKARLRKDQK